MNTSNGVGKQNLYKFFRYLAMFGNVVYIVWILYNGMNEGFKAKPVQLVSFIGILGLLAVNFILLYSKNN